MNPRTLSFGVLFVVGMSAASPAAAAGSSSVADFYRGRMVRIIVDYTPGGGFDTYSRLVARSVYSVEPKDAWEVTHHVGG